MEKYIDEVEVTTEQLKAYQIIQLNAELVADKYTKYNINLNYIAEEYIINDVPKQHIYNNIKDALNMAYMLHLNNKLHGLCIQVLKGKKIIEEVYTDALRYICKNDLNELNVLNNKIAEQQRELEIYKNFMKKYDAENLFKEYKENLKLD